MCIESLMPSNYLILCRPLLLRLSVFPSIRVFSNESVLRIRWPKYWSFSFNISPSNESDLTSYFRPNRNLVLELAPPYTDRLFSSCCQDRPVILRQPLLTDSEETTPHRQPHPAEVFCLHGQTCWSPPPSYLHHFHLQSNVLSACSLLNLPGSSWKGLPRLGSRRS